MTTESITSALSTVIDPELHRPITELGMVESVSVDSGIASIRILLTIAGCTLNARLRSDVVNAVSSIDGITDVQIDFGVMNEAQRNEVKKLIRGGREAFIPFAQPDSLTRVIGLPY